MQMQLVSERWGSLQHLTATLTEGRAAPGEQSAALMLEAGVTRGPFGRVHTLEISRHGVFHCCIVELSIRLSDDAFLYSPLSTASSVHQGLWHMIACLAKA